MASVVSIYPANGATINTGEDLTMVLYTTSQAYTMYLKVNGTQIGRVCYRGECNLTYGLYNGADSSGNQGINIFVPGSSIEDGQNTITLETEFYDGSTKTLTYTYNAVSCTRCGAPKIVTVNDSSSMITITKPEIILKWSGATSGTNNPIAGYFISYDISTDGSTWDTGYEHGVVSSTSTSGRETMTFMSAGIYYRFKVLTIGSADGWDSETATVSPVVYYSTALPVIFNGTQLTKIIYNGTTISSLVYNGTKLF